MLRRKQACPRERGRGFWHKAPIPEPGEGLIRVLVENLPELGFWRLCGILFLLVLFRAINYVLHGATIAIMGLEREWLR